MTNPALRPPQAASGPAVIGGDPLASEIDELALAALLSSRICHDLVGPVGALNNGVEIISDGADAELRNHAMSLIATSARQAAARLQFYRAAFGVGGSLGESAHLSELRDMTDRFLAGGRTTLEWTAEFDELDRRHLRLMMNLILIGVEALPRGGRLSVGLMRPTERRDGQMSMIVLSEGRSAKLNERAQSLLRFGRLEDGARLEPKEAPLLLTHRLARSGGADLNLGAETDRVMVAATL